MNSSTKTYINTSTHITLEQWNTKLSKLLIANSTILCFYLVTGMIGNSLVIYVYKFKMRGQRDDRYFIPYLAMMDLTACVVGGGFSLALNIFPVRIHGDLTCKVFWFLCSATTMCAGFMLIVIAVQRYLKVVRPFRKQMTLYWKHISLSLVIGVSVILTLPCLLFYGQIEVHNPELGLTGYRCGEYTHRQKYRLFLFLYNIVLFITAVGGLLCIVCLYALVGKTIYRQRRYRRRLSSAPFVKKTNNRDSLEWNPSSDNTPPPQQTKQCFRDSLDLLDSSTDEKPSGPDHGEDAPLRSKNLLTAKADGNVRFSFADPLEPIKALKSKIPTVRRHFGNHRCTWMFMLITLVFILSFIPRITLQVLESLDSHFWKKLTDKEICAYLFFYRLYLVNNISNPFFYGIFDRALRKELRCSCCSN